MEKNCYTKDILYSAVIQCIKKCRANCDAIPGKLFPGLSCPSIVQNVHVYVYIENNMLFTRQHTVIVLHLI